MAEANPSMSLFQGALLIGPFGELACVIEDQVKALTLSIPQITALRTIVIRPKITAPV
jgi:hypothetical protein